MGCVQSTGAAETKEREIARIVSAFNGDQSNGLLHIVVHNINDSLGKLLAVLPFRSPFERANRRIDAIDRERHRSAEKKLRKQAAENHIGIGDGETIAFAVADGTGIGARTFRT